MTMAVVTRGPSSPSSRFRQAVWSLSAYLRALADDRVAIGAAIDGYASADLHVVLDDYAPDLGYFEMRPHPEGEAEAVLSDMGAWMNDHPVADQRGEDCRRGPD